MRPLHKVRWAAGALAFFLCLDGFAQAPKALKLSNVLNGKRSCVLGNGSVQFLNKDELVLLAGLGNNCYKDISALELVTFSMDGRIIARKLWPSTYPFVAFDSHVAISGDREIMVLDGKLQTVQTLVVPTADRAPFSLAREGTATLLVRIPHAGGDIFRYSGLPLVTVQNPVLASGDTLVLSRENNEAIVLRGKKLLTMQPGGGSRDLADLTWLQDCNKLCQSWSGGIAWAVSANGERSAFISTSTRFPLTDESGAFPFWRVVVIDLSSGKEIFRKEFYTKTSRRSAQLSPDGKLLLLSDGDKLQFQSLP